MSLWAAQNIEETVCSWQDVRLGKVADLEEMDACRAKLISCFVSRYGLSMKRLRYESGKLSMVLAQAGVPL